MLTKSPRDGISNAFPLSSNLPIQIPTEKYGIVDPNPLTWPRLSACCKFHLMTRSFRWAHGPAHGKSGRFHWAQVRAHMDKSSKSQQKSMSMLDSERHS